MQPFSAGCKELRLSGSTSQIRSICVQRSLSASTIDAQGFQNYIECIGESSTSCIDARLAFLSDTGCDAACLSVRVYSWHWIQKVSSADAMPFRPECSAIAIAMEEQWRGGAGFHDKHAVAHAQCHPTAV